MKSTKSSFHDSSIQVFKYSSAQVLKYSSIQVFKYSMFKYLSIEFTNWLHKIVENPTTSTENC